MIRQLCILFVLNLACLVAADSVPSPQSLAALIRDETRGMEDRLQAVSEVGEGMVVSCIPALIDTIDQIRSQVQADESRPLSVTYPCVGALIKIGTPSTEPVLSALRLPQSALRQNLLREVIFQLEGEEGTRKYLEAIRSVNQRLPDSPRDAALKDHSDVLSQNDGKDPIDKKRSPNQIPSQNSKNEGGGALVTWPVWAVMIVASTGLLWLFFKNRK